MYHVRIYIHVYTMKHTCKHAYIHIHVCIHVLRIPRSRNSGALRRSGETHPCKIRVGPGRNLDLPPFSALSCYSLYFSVACSPKDR